MNTLVAGLALLSAVVLTGTAVSVFALHRSYLLVRQMEGKRLAPPTDTGKEMQEMREAIGSLAVQLDELRKHPPGAAEPAPGVPGPSLNLSRRSQALRMHRRGDTAEQIAAALDLPRQEVELLLKVHRIVLSSV
jgi:hypothetical protein